MERIEYVPLFSVDVLLAQMRLIGIRRKGSNASLGQIGECIACGQRAMRNGKALACCSIAKRAETLIKR